MTDDFTHTTEEGEVQMVDIGAKPDSTRRAVAQGDIVLAADTIARIRGDSVEKGDVLASARIGVIQAVKHTWEAIPLCHQIPITNIDVDHSIESDRVQLTVAVETQGKTGCEMEAIHGVVTGLTVIWDMVKALEKTPDGSYPDTQIVNVQVLTKEKHEIAVDSDS